MQISLHRPQNAGTAGSHILPTPAAVVPVAPTVVTAPEAPAVEAKKALDGPQAVVDPIDPRVINAVNDLGFELHAKIAEPSKSYFVSSVSIAYALAMLTNGAEGATQRQMLDGLGLEGMTLKEANDNFRRLTARLLTPTEGVEAKLANGIWADPSVKAKPEFVEALVKQFEAKWDVGDMNEAVGEINAFVSDTTHGLIPSVLDPGALNGAIMALVNAIYFKGSWTEEFDVRFTREAATFTRADGTTAEVDMMSKMKTRVPAKEGVDFEAVKLSYGKERTTSMVAIAPRGDASVASIMQELATPEGRAKYLAGYREARGNLYFPKMEVEFEAELKDHLSALGLPMGATFTGIDPKATVSFVKHVAKVKVDEKGTEAAAATVIGIERTSVEMPRILFSGDRPFVFLIVNEKTGAVTFTGAYEGP